MGLDRQYLVEILDAQGQQVGVLSASRINVVDSKITGTTPGTAASIVTYAGNGQSGTAGANIAIPPAVRVLDANGLPVAGSSVTWFHGGGSGTTSTGTVTTTNSNGVSQVGSWSLGTTAGSTYTLFAYSGNLTNSPIRFSCTPTAGSAFSISASRGTSQTTTPTGTMPSTLSACVHDQYGNPVNGASVTVTTTDANAVLGSAALTTASSGHCGTTYQAGEAASVASVLFAISSNTSARFVMTTVAGAATGITILSGDNQIAAVSTELPLPVTVAIDDGYGNAISSGETLQFVVVQGSGSVSRATATPTASQSSFTWAMGAGAGQNAVEISLQNRSNSTITAFASGTNPLADTIFAVAGTGQSATVGAALGAPIRWGVTGSGSSAAGQVVDLTVTGDAVLSTAQTTSTSTGLVNVTVTAGTVASIYTVTATAAGLAGSPSKITFEGVAGSATSLIVQTQPTSNPVPGVAWPQQPVIISTDVYGNLVSTNTRVGAVLTSGDGTLASSVSMFAVASGATATFSGLSYTQVATNAFQVVYRCNSLSTATGDQQTAQPPFATKLGFSTQPVGGNVNANIGSVVVAVQDSTGATVGTATDPVTLAIGTNPGGGALAGTTTKAAVAGLATFDDLTINAAGDGYTLNATATGLTGATSAAFDVAVASAAFPNKPAHLTTILGERTWNTATESGWANGSNGQGTLRTDFTDAPYSPPNGSRYNKAIGSAGASMGKTECNTTDVTEMYQSAWLRLSSTFDGHLTRTNKLGPWISVGGGYQVFLNGYGRDTEAIKAEIYFQGLVPNLGGNDASGHRRALSTTGFSQIELTRGVWHQVEMYFKINTFDVADGIFRLYVDGVQCVEWTNAAYIGTGTVVTTTPSTKFTAFQWNPIWGGGGDAVTTTTYIDVDHFIAYGP